MEKKNCVVSVRVPDELLACLVSVSEELHVTVSALVCSVLTSFVDGYKARNK